MKSFFKSHIVSRVFTHFCLICLLVMLFSWCNCQTATNWQNLFKQSYYNSYDGFLPLRKYWLNLSNSNKVTDFEPLSYGLDAILAMYEATKEQNYIEDAITITNNIVGKAQPTDHIPLNKFILKDSYRGWIEQGDSLSGIFHLETVLSEIYFFEYVGRLLKDIHNNDKMYNNPVFKSFYDKTLTFVEVNIWDKWENRGIRFAKDKYNYLLLSRTHMASHWAYLAAELYFLTKSSNRKTDYFTFVNLYNNKLENNFYKYNKYISWNQTWNLSNNSTSIIQDVSHANLVISYLVEAYDLGLWKDYDTIQRIINTLKDKLWDSKDCLFADNIDGTMFTVGMAHSTIGSFQADGFVKLTRFDKSLFILYRQFINCTKYLTAWYQYGQLFANLSLSQKLINE